MKSAALGPPRANLKEFFLTNCWCRAAALPYGARQPPPPGGDPMRGALGALLLRAPPWQRCRMWRSTLRAPSSTSWCGCSGREARGSATSCGAPRRPSSTVGDGQRGGRDSWRGRAARLSARPPPSARPRASRRRRALPSALQEANKKCWGVIPGLCCHFQALQAVSWARRTPQVI